MPLERIVVPPNPARLLYALASIGYDTEVALCDIIDNSFDAQCRRIEVAITPILSPSGEESGAIDFFLIADDGVGMGRDELVNALKIGSDRIYQGDHLGKFGIGLKSAALALGNRLTVISKRTDAVTPICAILSAFAVMTDNEYFVELGTPSDDLLELWRRNAPDANHGTLVMISELNSATPAQVTFSEFFGRYCSITYHMLMSGENAVSLKLNSRQLEPIDPLFPEEADANGRLVPSEWSGKKVQRLLAPTSLDLGSGVSALVEATQLVHPPSFEEDGRRNEVRDHYMVDRDPYTAAPRHGFYVYRNNRVIVMAERFRGIVPSQTSSWAFRARLMFEEGADEILKLDVKKRHCTLPRRARQNLTSLAKSYVALSAEGWREAGRSETQRKGTRKEAAANASIANSSASSLSYTSGMDPSGLVNAEDQAASLLEMQRASVRSIQDGALSGERIAELLRDKVPVIFANGLRGNPMWMPHPAPEVGQATVLINRNNTWVENAYATADENAELYVTLHYLFFILSRAEIEVRSHNFEGFSSELAGKVFETFRRRVGAISEDLAVALDQIYAGIAEGKLDDEEE
jgi:hypothetical protein